MEDASYFNVASVDFPTCRPSKDKESARILG